LVKISKTTNSAFYGPVLEIFTKEFYICRNFKPKLWCI